MFKHIRTSVRATMQLRLYERKRDLSGNRRKKQVRWIVDHHLYALCCAGVDSFKVESLAEYMTRSTHVLDLVRACAKFGHIDLLNFFLAKGRNFDVKFDVDMCKRVAVEMAAKHGQLGVLRCLLDGSKGMVNKGVAFKIACSHGWKDIVWYLMDCMRGKVHQRVAIINDGFLNASVHGRMDVLEILVDMGFDRLIFDDSWMIALEKTTSQNHINVVKLLVQKGQFVTANRNCNVAVIIASMNNRLDILKVLLDTGRVNLNTQISKYRYRTALHFACRQGHLDLVKLLLETGQVEVDSVDGDGKTPLMYACGGGHVEIAKLLIETGNVDLNEIDYFGMTPLLHACKHGNVEIAELLIETENVLLNELDDFERSALMYACEGGHVEIAKLLIETGNVPLDEIDYFGKTLLMYACESGHIEIVKLLVKTGRVNVNAADSNGMTALMIACDRQNVDVVSTMLNAENVKVNVRDCLGMTALMHACINAIDTRILQILLEMEAIDVNPKIGQYPSAMSLAVLFRREDAVKLLLDSGRLTQSEIQAAWKASAADGTDAVLRAIVLSGRLQVNGLDGDSLMNHACEYGAVNIVRQLVQLGDVNIIASCNSKTPLMLAAENGHLDIVKLLLEVKEVHVNHQDEYGRTALSYACRMKHVAIAKCILESSPHVDQLLRDRYNKDPLAYASENGCLDAIKLLLTSGHFEHISKEMASVDNAISCATAKCQHEIVLPTLHAYRRALSRVNAGMSKSAFSC